MEQIITIFDDKTPWRFTEKEEDMTCCIKNIQSGNEYNGKIISMNSKGSYRVEITGRASQL